MSARALPLVLVVEDDPQFRKSLALCLLDMGFTVASAASVRDGIAALAGGPGVLVLDMLLPDGNGVEVLREAKRRNLVGLSAVVTVAPDQVKMLTEIAAFRPDNLFIKPIDPLEICKWLRRRCMGEQQPPPGGGRAD